MENVSKALIIAGAVLIGVLLIFNFTTSMNSVGTYTSSYTEKMDATELAQYNNKFDQYVGTDISMYDCVSLTNEALNSSYEANFDSTNEYYIQVEYKFLSSGTSIVGGTESSVTNLWTTIGFTSNMSTTDYNDAVKVYKNLMFTYLKTYYDDSIEWSDIDDNASGTNKGKPAFTLSINSYNNGRVSHITFTEQKRKISEVVETD